MNLPEAQYHAVRKTSKFNEEHTVVECHSIGCKEYAVTSVYTKNNGHCEHHDTPHYRECC